MEVVTVVPMYGYILHATRLTPQLQAWMNEIPEEYAPWLGYAHNIPLHALCSRWSGTTMAIYTTPFESLENEVTETIWTKKQNSVCMKCQRILRASKLKETND